MASYHFYFLILLSGILAEDSESEDSDNEVGTKISQGQPTTIARYPSLVQVEFYWDSWQQNCAGNIIHKYYIISAAHCFYGGTVFNRRIRAGSGIRNTGGVIINLVNSYIHPNFGRLDLDSDIALAQLASPLQYSPTIQPTNVIYQDIELPDGTEVRAAGWGKTSQTGYQSDILLDVTIYTINHELCRQRSQTYYKQFALTTNMICAGLLDVGGRDTCPGDSGGGLFYQDILIGIVSWGRGCGNYYFPGVYTKISHFRYWIESIVLN